MARHYTVRCPRRTPYRSRNARRTPRQSRSPRRTSRSSKSSRRTPRRSRSPRRSPRRSRSSRRSPRRSRSPRRTSRSSRSPGRTTRRSRSHRRSSRSPRRTRRRSRSPRSNSASPRRTPSPDRRETREPRMETSKLSALDRESRNQWQYHRLNKDYKERKTPGDLDDDEVQIIEPTKALNKSGHPISPSGKELCNPQVPSLSNLTKVEWDNLKADWDTLFKIVQNMPNHNSGPPFVHNSNDDDEVQIIEPPKAETNIPYDEMSVDDLVDLVKKFKGLEYRQQKGLKEYIEMIEKKNPERNRELQAKYYQK